MAKIIVTRPSEHALEELGVFNWATWECEPSTFEWHYDQKETGYILEGDVRVTWGNGESIEIGPGDLAVFPAGLDCLWEVRSAVRKHYKFE